MNNLIQSAILSTFKTTSAAPPVDESDPYFGYTTFLLHGDGTNGAQNNTFIDGSSNAFTVTRYGNATQGTFSPFSVDAGKWSNYFDGSGDYLTVANSSDFEIGNDWTFDVWVYPSTSGSFRSLYSYLTAGSTLYGVTIALDSNNQVGVYGYNNGDDNFDGSITFGGTVSANEWTRITVVRSGGTWSLYLDAVAQSGSGTMTAIAYTGTPTLYIGRQNNNFANEFAGYMSNYRVVKGSALTPSSTTTSLTAVTNTKLLTCQSSRFIDTNTEVSAKTITVNGNTSVQPFSPFEPVAAYSSGTNGASGHFDGTGDYLTVPDSAAFRLGSGNFTFEAWVYTKAAANQMIISSVDYWRNAFLVQIKSDKTIQWNICDVESSAGVYDTITSTGTININCWNHIAVVRNSGTATIYINGVASGTTSSTRENYDATAAWAIGSDGGSYLNSTLMNGYIANLRLVKSAVYTSNFTPPTTPLTNITDTVLLLNFTNAGIIDNTAKNVLETVGNAQIDTTTKKFGTGALEFDGNGDYLTTPSNQWVSWGTGDFTIEAWIYWDSLSSESAIMWGSGVGWTFYIYPANKLQWGTTSPQTPANLLQGSTTLSTGQWYHIAVTRASNTITLWVNGQSDGTVTDSANYSAAGSLQVGVSHSGNYFDGFIDDLRITKGLARYTSTFTPPTAPFLDY